MNIETMVKKGKINLADLKKCSEEEQYKVFMYLAMNGGRIYDNVKP